jgi:hypothetical protein
MNRCATVPNVGGTFFPLRSALRLDNHNFSPTVLALIARAMGRLNSAAQATFALQLARINISCSQVQRIAQEIGHELAAQRDHKVAQQRRRELPVRVEVTPAVVAVEVDGGHLRTRAADRGPGVHEVQGKENKVAALVTLKSTTTEHDPQPEPPPAFAEPRRVQRLMQQLNGWAGEPPQAPENRASEPVAAVEPPEARNGPKRLVRTCVASMADSHRFGPMMAAEAQERGFYHASRKAFISDGAAYNGSIWRGYFGDFEPITDFLHAVCYVYGAAWGVGGTEAERWSLYQTWMRACWQGRVGEVLALLTQCQVRVGPVPEGEELPTRDPRRLVAEALSYLSNNQSRMDYPRYRRAGLPITSSLVESLVGEFNARLKSPQTFWNRPNGPEPILQLRAAVLSEDDHLDRFFAQRPGCHYRSHKVA